MTSKTTTHKKRVMIARLAPPEAELNGSYRPQDIAEGYDYGTVEELCRLCPSQTRPGQLPWSEYQRIMDRSGLFFTNKSGQRVLRSGWCSECSCQVGLSSENATPVIDTAAKKVITVTSNCSYECGHKETGSDNNGCAPPHGGAPRAEALRS